MSNMRRKTSIARAIPFYGGLTYFVLTGVYYSGMIGTFGYAVGGAD
jgi:hypothetical protein